MSYKDPMLLSKTITTSGENAARLSSAVWRKHRGRHGEKCSGVKPTSFIVRATRSSAHLDSASGNDDGLRQDGVTLNFQRSFNGSGVRRFESGRQSDTAGSRKRAAMREPTRELRAPRARF